MNNNSAAAVNPNTDEELQRTQRPNKTSPSDFVWRQDTFHLIGRESVNMTVALSKLSAEQKESFQQATLSFSAKGGYSQSVILNIVSVFGSALKQCSASAFNIEWISQAVKVSRFASYIGAVKNFFLFWKARNNDAISEDALQFLKKTNIRKTQNKNVLSDDPEKSWLTDEEYEALLTTIWRNYEDKLFTTSRTFMLLLSMQYGRRPVQLAHLKIKDFSITQPDNKLSNTLMVSFPSVKDASSETGFRDSKFENHPIPLHLWNLFEILRSEVRTLVETKMNIPLSNSALESLPIFMTEDRLTKVITILSEHYRIDWRENLAHQLFHLKPHSVSRILSWKPGGRREKEKIVFPISHRTGRALVVNATRIRHTRARQLARKGVSIHVLSHWLGHTSRYSLSAYYNDPAEDARKLNELMAPKLVPIAMAFAGKLINSEAQASRHYDPTSRLELAKNGELKNVGNCGKHSFCATTSVPIPCYRCRHFEPLVTADHQEVLEVLRLRQSEENELLKIGGTKRLLVPIDLSADIIAVQNCIDRCNARKIELGIK